MSDIKSNSNKEAVSDKNEDDSRKSSIEQNKKMEDQSDKQDSKDTIKNSTSANEEDSTEEPRAKKTKLLKDNAVNDNFKDSVGNEQTEDKRSTRGGRGDASNKRVSMMVKTAKEGEALLKELGHKDDHPESERRRTRSQTRGVPLPAVTPQKTVKRTNLPRRGKKGRPRKDEKLAKQNLDDEKEEESMEEATNSADNKDFDSEDGGGDKSAKEEDSSNAEGDGPKENAAKSESGLKPVETAVQN